MEAQSDSSQKKSVIDFKHRIIDNVPFIVFVEHEIKNLGRLFRVGHYLLEADKNISESILDIKIVGVSRVKVLLSNYSAANALVNNEILRKQKLISYLPKFCTQKKGIVTDG